MPRSPDREARRSLDHWHRGTEKPMPPTDLRPALRRNIVKQHRKNAHRVIHDKTARFLLGFIAEPFDFLLTVLRAQITVGNEGDHDPGAVYGFLNNAIEKL